MDVGKSFGKWNSVLEHCGVEASPFQTKIPLRQSPANVNVPNVIYGVRILSDSNVVLVLAHLLAISLHDVS